MPEFDLFRFDDPSQRFRFQLPVDPQFALVDEVTLEPPNALLTRWTVPAAAPYLRGIAPGPWILPGTVMSEMAVQSGELLIAAHRGPTTTDEGIPVLTRLKRGAFKRVVQPGETLRCRVELEGEAGPAFFVRAQLSCGDAAVAQLSLAFAATRAVEALGV